MKKTNSPDLSHIVEKLQPLAAPMEQLVLDPANARAHDERNIEVIKASLARYKQRVPLVVNKQNGVIEKGNGTFRAAQLLGWTHIAVVDVDDDPVTAAGYSVTDNRSGELADWDYAMLAPQLEALQEAAVDLEALGWQAPDIEDVIAQWKALDAEDGTDQSDGSLLALTNVAISPPEHKVERGDVWRLGMHVLICAEVLTGWPQWIEFLERYRGGEAEGLAVFAPYPGPFVPLTVRAQEKRLIMVQPDVYIAGHILDQWDLARPEDKAAQVQ